MTLGPWLQTAAFCERVAELSTADQAAALGIVERLSITAGEPTRLHLLIAVVRGGWTGPFAIRVVARGPSDDVVAVLEVTQDPQWDAELTSRIVIPLSLVAGAPGVYWFDVLFAGALVTRVPLRIDWNPARLLF